MIHITQSGSLEAVEGSYIKLRLIRSSGPLVCISLIPSNSVLFYVWELLAVNTHKDTYLLTCWLFDAGESCFVPNKFI